jgi:hypothetical protein
LLDLDPASLSFELSEEAFLHHTSSRKPHQRRRLPPTFSPVKKIIRRGKNNVPRHSSKDKKNKNKKPNNSNKKKRNQKQEISTSISDKIGNRQKKQGSSSNLSPKDKDDDEDKKMTAMLNPKPPLDLPIVKPEVQKLENEPAAKLIPTKGKPFHFHIPVLTKEPQKKIDFDGNLKD